MGQGLAGKLGGARAASSGTTNHVSGLGSVFAGVLLCGLSGTSGVMGSKILDLVGLGVDNVGSVGNLLVDGLLILDVYQGPKIQERDADE